MAHIKKNNIVNAYGKTKVYILKNGKTYITNINNYNAKETEYVLNAQGYIDVRKNITFSFGGNTVSGMASGAGELYPFNFYDPNDPDARKKILKFTIYENSLKLSCEIYGFDGKNICRISNNKLIVVQQGCKVYASDNYFEVIDDYNIPVLQIELIKKDNTIKLGGAFNFDKSFYIMTDKGMYPSYFGQRKKLMSQTERDEILDIYLTAAKKIKPIHE